MNKKAQTFTIFHYMIVGFLFVVFCAGLIYVSGLLNDVFHEVGVANEVNIGKPTYVNMTLASDQIWGQHYQSIKALRMVSIVYLLAMGAGIIIVGALERKHPFMFFVYILIVLLGVIFSPAISNAYESLKAQGIFGGELSNFTGTDWILLNLPTVIMVIGMVSAIFLFINLVRAPSSNLDARSSLE